MTDRSATSVAPVSRAARWRRWLAERPALPFLAPAVLYLVVLTLFPFVYSVILSGTRYNLARPDQTGFVGAANYGNLLSADLFQVALWHTFLVTVASIALELGLGFFIARLFHALAGVPMAAFLRTVFILPMLITPLVSGLLWSYIFNPTLGIANYLLRSLGLSGIGWFSSAQTALPTVILVNSWQWLPFLMLIMLAGLVAIPAEHYEAARLDGARWHHLVRHIELPALRNVIVIGIVFRVIDNLKLFDIVYAATNGGPGNSTEVITMYAFRQMFLFFNAGFGSAVAVVVLVIAVVLSMIAVRFLRPEESRVR